MRGYLPPIVVFFDGTTHWLADGYHRWHAHNAIDLTEIEADVRQGDKIAALRYSLAANAQHGKRREPGDLRKAYRIAVRNGLCEADDAEAVRGLLGCTERWARTLTQVAREEAKATRDEEIARLAAAGRSERQIAAETGVPNITVHDVIARKRKCSVSEQDGRTTEPTILYSPAGEPKSSYASGVSPFAAHSHVDSPAFVAWNDLFDRMDALNEGTDVDALLAERCLKLEPRRAGG